MDSVLKSAYWHDQEARAAFQRFVRKIFGFDFVEWDARGYLDEALTPFSFFVDGEVVANICIYSMEAVIDGEQAKIAQVSAVGTLAPWRRRGLNRRLTEIGLEWAGERHAGIFVFSADAAVPFYESCGFVPRTEYLQFTSPRKTAHRDGACQLDPSQEADLRRIYQYAEFRTPISDCFSVLNPKMVVFHALQSLRECVFEIPELECLVFMRRDDSTLRLFDIVGSRIPALDDLYPYLACETDRLIEFHFCADKLQLDRVNSRPLHGNNLFVREGFPLTKPVFPYTARA